MVGRNAPPPPFEGVSISLRYYRQEAECFSVWSHVELKRFVGVVSKLKNMSAETLRGHNRLCVPHRHKPKEHRFSRPEELSKELPMFEIKIDPHNAARIHGVFVGSVFHLVWLDRKHAVFPFD